MRVGLWTSPTGCCLPTIRKPSTLDTRVLVEKLGMTLLGVGLNKARIDGHTDSNGPEAYNDRL